ncbi:MAG: hypothetical protein FWD61_05535 [Phycisphaerales bacterium]|nr:hypothetical protein [Phycisphaerales bacterium]
MQNETSAFSIVASSTANSSRLKARRLRTRSDFCTVPTLTLAKASSRIFPLRHSQRENIFTARRLWHNPAFAMPPSRSTFTALLIAAGVMALNFESSAISITLRTR